MCRVKMEPFRPVLAGPGVGGPHERAKYGVPCRNNIPRGYLVDGKVFTDSTKKTLLVFDRKLLRAVRVDLTVHFVAPRCVVPAGQEVPRPLDLPLRLHQGGMGFPVGGGGPGT